jgi:hypothetical protein
MGFRATWLENDGLLSVHTEDFLHAVERAIPDKPIHMLLVGVGNGGSVEVWRKVLPEGSVVSSIDSNPKVNDLDLGTVILDIQDIEAVRDALKGQWFHVIIDSTGDFSPHLWPYLRAGGALICNEYNPVKLADLVTDIADDVDSWLPTEEIMSVMIFTNVFIAEKRNPRVVPYLEIITGSKDPVISESVYRTSGAKRVTPTPQPSA